MDDNNQTPQAISPFILDIARRANHPQTYVRASLSPEEVEDLENLGCAVKVGDISSNQFGRRWCTVTKAKEVAS